MDKEKFIKIIKSEQDFQKRFLEIVEFFSADSLYEDSLYENHGRIFDELIYSIVQDEFTGIVFDFVYHIYYTSPNKRKINTIDELYNFINEHDGWLK